MIAHSLYINSRSVFPFEYSLFKYFSMLSNTSVCVQSPSVCPEAHHSLLSTLLERVKRRSCMG